MAPTPHRTALSVNLNKVALVRNTRHLGIPSVTRAATLCLQAGAAGITVHPRPDANVACRCTRLLLCPIPKGSSPVTMAGHFRRMQKASSL